MTNEPSLSLQIAGPAALALASLSPSQKTFIRALPKAELHAHLNGSIPLSTLHDLARHNHTVTVADPAIKQGLEVLERGVILTEISDFFGLFPAIYALTSTPSALQIATKAVLSHFLDPSPVDGFAECTYLELRTGPRKTAHMSRRQYLEAVLAEVEGYPDGQAALIVALDRPMLDDDMGEVVDLAIALKNEGRRVVGVDLCGNPFAGDVSKICGHVRRAKEAGLGVTLHVAETAQNPTEETIAFLDMCPDRLGHATFLDEAAKQRVVDDQIGIELCLTSNVLTKTVPSLADHHIMWYIARKHPVTICTDDILPFRTSLTAEYALLMAPVPLGLGLGEDEVRSIAASGIKLRLGTRSLRD